MSRATHPHSAVDRRDVLRALGLGISSALLPAGVLATSRITAQRVNLTTSGEAIITRAIPSSGEQVPAIGLGTFMTFDVLPGGPRDHLKEVMRLFWEAGGRVIDTSPLYGTAEVTVGDFATALGIGDQLFIANKIWATGEYLGDVSHATRSLERSLQRLWRERIDLMQCHSLVNADVVVPLLRAWKKEGQVRYVGVTHHEPAYTDLLADWVERGGLDFVQVNYSVLERRAEERLLPAAADRGVAVLVNMPFGKARLFKLVEGRPLPDFARELGIENWAQYFLKWVISHPAVTCALPSTSNPAHVVDNMGALRGPLPDRRTRERMLRHLESIPGFDELAGTPWYPDKQYRGTVTRAQGELRARQ